jgi:hypothetical protein
LPVADTDEPESAWAFPSIVAGVVSAELDADAGAGSAGSILFEAEKLMTKK